MADTGLPATGEDTTVTVTVDGALRRIVEVTNFTADGIYNRTETQPLGTSETLIDDRHRGWTGTIEVSEVDGSPDSLADDIHAAQHARVPMVINIANRKFYRNGTNRRYTYPDCKLQVKSRQRRGEAITVTFEWSTGKDRIEG